jgi:signal transduction histidine kinase
MFFKHILGLNEKIKSKVYVILSFIISIIIFVLTVIEIGQSYRMIIGVSIYFVYSLLFKGKWNDKIFYNLVFNFVQISAEILTINLLRFIFKISVVEIISIYGATRIVTGLIVKFFKYTILKVIAEYVKPQENILSPKYNLLVWLIYAISIISMILLFDLTRGMEHTESFDVLLIFISTTYLFINGVIYLFIIELNKHHIKQKERAIIDMHYKAAERYFKMNQETNIEIRKIRHDINNHLANIKNLVSTKSNDKINEYINIIEEDLDMVPITIRTGNEIADMVLNQKKIEAKSHDIAFKVNAVIPPDTDINPPDLSSLLFNSIDNSIEACFKIKDKSKRKIEIVIYPKKDYLYFEISNSIYKNAKIHRGMTSKKDKNKHGYGLIILEDIAVKYNGFIDYEVLDGEFKLYMAVSLKDTTSLTKKATSLT